MRGFPQFGDVADFESTCTSFERTFIRINLRIRHATHTGHHTQDIVRVSIHSDLGSVGSNNSSRRKDKLEGSIVDSGEVACAAGLMLLGPEGKGVYVDASIGGTGVVLEGLDNVEVRTLSLRDSVLAVKLELSGDNRVLAPAVHVEGGLSEHECAGIGDEGAVVGATSSSVKDGVVPATSIVKTHCASGHKAIKSTGHLEDTAGDEGVDTRCLSLTAEDGNRGRESINGIGVVEGLGTHNLVQGRIAFQGIAVVNVGIGLNNPDKFLAGVVEVDLDLVTGRTDRLITSVLELLNEVLVGVLGHLSALISIQEDEVNIDRGSNKGLLVSSGDSLGSTSGIRQRPNSPQALANGSEVNVDLDLMVLESDQRQSKAGVSAEPEEEGDVQGGLGESLARSANLAGATCGSARAVDVGESGVAQVCKLSGVTNHLVVTSLLLRREGKLIPDVHPVTILAVNPLATDLDLNEGDQLLTGVVQPTGIDRASARGSHTLVNLRESNLDIGAVSQISISGDGAGHTATEIGLAVECLLDGLHREVGMASVRHLPESDLGVSS